MTETFLLKNILSPSLVYVLADNINREHAQFDKYAFENLILETLETLELKQRAALIAKAMRLYLPKDVPKALNILIRCMAYKPKEADLGRYSEFYFMPFAEFIGRYANEYFNEGMKANYELTKVFTAEFSVRVFIEKYPDKSLQMLHKWTQDENHHVRRLVSEGSRPRLPWASRLPAFQKDPKPVLELLEKLKADPELYVRRSVANNLNDIAKDHPDIVIDTLTRWKGDANENTSWIVRHASRSLIKSGHHEALLLQGFNPKVNIKLFDLKASQSVDFGQKLDFSFRLKNMEESVQKLVIDFVIYFKKANGKLAPKVFKLSEKSINPDEIIDIAKSHPIKPISTRAYYPGTQKLAIQVNGQERGEVEFELLMD